MFELYTYSDQGELIFQMALETVEKLHFWIDDFQAKGADTYWEWVEE